MSLRQIIKFPVLWLYLALSRRWPRTLRQPLDPRNVRKVLLLQFGGIGDSLRAIPLVRMLGEAFPQAQLATLTNQSPGLFCLGPEDLPACRHLTFDFDNGPATKWRRIRELRAERFDLIVLPIVGDGFMEIAFLARLIGARWFAGFDLDGGGLCFTHRIPFSRNQSLLTQYCRLLNAIGVPGAAISIPLRRDREAAAAVAARLETLGLTTTPLIVVQPWVGNHEKFKAWPPASFRELIRRLVAELEMAVLVVGSPAERALSAQYFSDLTSPRFRDLTGAFTFSETVALVARSRCLVCNDSCLISIADSFGVPSVGIFGATDPGQTLSAASLCRVVRTDEKLPCQPCYVHQTLFAYKCSHDFRCLTTLSVERVLKSVKAVLAGATA